MIRWECQRNPWSWLSFSRWPSRGFVASRDDQAEQAKQRVVALWIVAPRHEVVMELMVDFRLATLLKDAGWCCLILVDGPRLKDVSFKPCQNSRKLWKSEAECITLYNINMYAKMAYVVKRTGMLTITTAFVWSWTELPKLGTLRAAPLGLPVDFQKTSRV